MRNNFISGSYVYVEVVPYVFQSAFYIYSEASIFILIPYGFYSS